MQMARTTTNTMAAKSVMPSLTVDNLQQSLDFFSTLGFELEDKWEQDGKLLGAMVKAGDVHLGLNQDDGKKGSRVKGAGMRLYIEARDDINALAARVKAAGVELAKEPFDTEWGTRAFELVEPTGFQLTIMSPS